MEMSSAVSSPRNSGVEEEDKEEESGWTEYFVDYEIRRIQEEQGDEDKDEGEDEDEDEDEDSMSMMMSRSVSMLSDAGSGPEWKLRRAMVSSIPRRVNMNKCKEMTYDDSLEDTASSPVNSPKINQYFKTMDINSRRPEETFHTTYFGKGRAKDSVGEEDFNVVMKQTRNLINGLDEASRSLVPNTQLLNMNYYNTNFPPF